MQYFILRRYWFPGDVNKSILYRGNFLVNQTKLTYIFSSETSGHIYHLLKWEISLSSYTFFHPDKNLIASGGRCEL